MLGGPLKSTEEEEDLISALINQSKTTVFVEQSVVLHGSPNNVVIEN